MSNSRVETAKSKDSGTHEIDFVALISLLWRKKLFLTFFVMLSGIVGAAYIVRVPNVYKAEIMLAPAEESSGGGISALVGQLGGLASLAGVNIGKGETNKVDIAIKVIRSRAFISEFIRSRGLLVPLVAAESWDKETGELVINERAYDKKTDAWLGEFEKMPNRVPTDWYAYRVFIENLQVSKEKETGIITVSFWHVSPVIAKQWLEWLIEDVNKKMRERDIDDANKSIEYLKRQLDKTPVAGLQQVFYQLIEKQMQIVMLANVRDQYVLKVIDPPLVPEEKDYPNRALFVLFCSFFGGACAAIYLVLRFRNAET